MSTEVVHAWMATTPAPNKHTHMRAHTHTHTHHPLPTISLSTHRKACLSQALEFSVCSPCAGLCTLHTISQSYVKRTGNPQPNHNNLFLHVSVKNIWKSLSVTPTLDCSPIHTALSVRESCTDTQPRCLCESYRCREEEQFRCRGETASMWMEKPVGVCRSDCVHSLTAEQILYLSNKREMSHISTHKAMLQDQTTAIW